MKMITGALVGLVLLAGCSSSGSGEAAPTPTPTPSVVTATAAQFASIVAEEKASLEDVAANVDGCDPEFDGATCLAYATTAEFALETLIIKLEGAADPAAGTYIGAPPAEITGLVDETLEAARTAQTASKAFADCSGDCASQWYDAQYKVGRLKSQLDGWSPYL